MLSQNIHRGSSFTDITLSVDKVSINARITHTYVQVHFVRFSLLL